ncbi:MAG: hypothetical protein A4E30_01362 [Methanomassiliicoccales archaeon PtaB.Bin215]|nr:MAG: hypothetical protein A4E30_01362 [Methanomassiliicoccales archaeon PtaB.Bin215]
MSISPRDDLLLMSETSLKASLGHASVVRVLEKTAGFSGPVADDVALRVLNYFGYLDEIIDNALDHDDRRLFYFLQDMKILSTRWEETQLASGRNWRIFYWSFNWDNINRILEDRPPKNEPVDLYRSLPDSVWCRHEQEGVA